jgi:hypothetical protein
MKLVFLFSGHIRCLGAIKRTIYNILHQYRLHDITLVFSTSKYSYISIKNEKKNFDKHENIVDDTYIKNFFPHSKVHILYDDDVEYREFYRKHMEIAFCNLISLNLTDLSEFNKSVIKVFLKEYEKEIIATYHVHSWLARAVDEICHIAYGTNFIKKNIQQCEFIIVTRPDVILYNLQLDNMLKYPKNIYTNETSVEHSMFVCPGFFAGNSDLIYKIFENFSFGEMSELQMTAESQIGINISRNVPAERWKFFDSYCGMFDNYYCDSTGRDYFVRYIDNHIDQIDGLPLITACNLRYYFFYISQNMISFAEWHPNINYIKKSIVNNIHDKDTIDNILFLLGRKQTFKRISLCAYVGMRDLLKISFIDIYNNIDIIAKLCIFKRNMYYIIETYDNGNVSNTIELWLCLIFGCIPIFCIDSKCVKIAGVNIDLNSIPHVIVGNLNEMTEQYLYEEYEKLKTFHYNYDRILQFEILGL